MNHATPLAASLTLVLLLGACATPEATSQREGSAEARPPRATAPVDPGPVDPAASPAFEAETLTAGQRIRRQELSVSALRAYEEGRAALRKRDYGDAIRHFERVGELLRQAPWPLAVGDAPQRASAALPQARQAKKAAAREDAIRRAGIDQRGARDLDDDRAP